MHSVGDTLTTLIATARRRRSSENGRRKRNDVGGFESAADEQCPPRSFRGRSVAEASSGGEEALEM